jgi:hypothetical protein
LLLSLGGGDARDGAPTHHAERALVASWFVLAGFGADVAGERALALPRGRALGAALATLAAFVLFDAWRAARPPGTSAAEDRSMQLARGQALQPYAIRVTPCSFEHFALLAAYGAPERAEIAPAEAGREECPGVELR